MYLLPCEGQFWPVRWWRENQKDVIPKYEACLNLLREKEKGLGDFKKETISFNALLKQYG
jgi:hypothetical protein